MDHARRDCRQILKVGVLLIATGCGADKLVLPAEGDPSTIDVLSGNDQTGTVGGSLADSVVVRVADARGRPVKGQLISFLATTGGAGGQILPDTIRTDAGGRAAAHWQLGTVAGAQQAQARVENISSQLAASLTATANPGQPDSLVQEHGDDQISQTGTVLPESLIVRLVDQFGNSIGGADVQWSTQDGSLSGATVTTGSDGRSAVQWTLGINPGTQHAAATFAGVSGSPAAFSASATVGPPPRLVIIVQPSAAAMSGVPFARQPQVQVEDDFGNPILKSGIAVTATIVSGGGNLGGGHTVLTDAGGTAQFMDLSIGGAVGPRTIIFAATAHTSATSTSINVTAGAPHPGQSTIVASPGTIVASAGSSSATITVTAKDAFGNPVIGAAVVLAATGNGNHLTQPGPTNSNGVAAGSLSSTVVGGKVLSATINAITVNQTPTITVTPGSADPGGTSAVVPATGTAGIASSISVTVKDAFGNPVSVGGAVVTVLVTGANSATAPVTDHGNGIYTARYTPSTSGTDAVAIRLNGAAINGSPFSSVIGPGSVSGSMSTVTAAPSSVTVSAGGNQITITVTARDAFGNFVPGGTVHLAASGTGNTVTQPAAPTSAGGVATGTLSSTVSGRKTVTATIDGVAVTQSVFVSFNPGPPDPAMSSALVPNGRVVQPTNIVVTARDQWGNRLTSGGASVVITVSGSNPRNPITANDIGNGTYTASYSPLLLGSDTITIMLNGAPIAGSPFTSIVGL